MIELLCVIVGLQVFFGVRLFVRLCILCSTIFGRPNRDIHWNFWADLVVLGILSGAGLYVSILLGQ
jgi:hypothetical protein